MRRVAQIIPFKRAQRWLTAAVVSLSLFGSISATVAHETDQYSVPLGREHADLRLFFARDVHGRLSNVIRTLNNRIDSTLVSGQPTTSTERYYEPEAVARAMLLEYPAVIFFIEHYDMWLRSPAVKAEYPGLVVSYMPLFWIYHHWALVLDPTKLVRLGRCSTVMVDGVYFGVDKYAHFVHMGYIYFLTYRRALNQGVGEDEAVARAVSNGTGGNFFFSENGLLGRLTTGVRSNGDLAANYSGYKFYRNLTEPVRLKGEIRPPLCVRDGAYWRLNDHVRPNSDYFTHFISDHWNEALNPNTYNAGIGGLVRQELAKRCDQVLDWYRDEHGRQRAAADFLEIARDLETYYGEDYGHCGNVESLVQIANTCFDSSNEIAILVPVNPERDASTLRASAVVGPPFPGGTAPFKPASPDAPGSAHNYHTDVSPIVFAPDSSWIPPNRNTSLVADRPGGKNPKNEVRPILKDPHGRTELWWAVYRNDRDKVGGLISTGVDVNSADIDDETPLHCAARWGYVESAEILLAAGANPDAASTHGMRPLHVAVRELRPEMVALLLSHGADPNARDHFECSPLHDAAAKGEERIVQMLLQAGANPRKADSSGTTPLHRAARAGHSGVAQVLLAAGGNAATANTLGRTPNDEARRGGFVQLAQMLDSAAEQPSKTSRIQGLRPASQEE